MNGGHEPGSTCVFSGTWECPYQPPSVSHTCSLRCGEKSVGLPMGHACGTPQEVTQSCSCCQPLHGVSASCAYTLPSTRQYGKKSASICRTTFPARFVRVPPARSTTDFERESAG